MFQRLHQNPHHIWYCARSGWWPWCSKKLHQNPHPGRLLRRWGGVGVVFQNVVPESPRLGSMGWCSKSWGGAPKSCPRIPTARWGGVPKVRVVFQKVVPESSMGWCSKSWGGVPKGCPRIPTARWGGVPKVGLVFQKIVPESPLRILLILFFHTYGYIVKDVH